MQGNLLKCHVCAVIILVIMPISIADQACTSQGASNTIAEGEDPVIKPQCTVWGLQHYSATSVLCVLVGLYIY